MDWIPLLRFPIEWGALALFVVACLYGERAGFTGLGVEGTVAAAMIGFIAGYDATASYAAAAGIAAGAAVLFALATGALLLLLRTDRAVGSFAASLVTACGLGLLTRTGTHALLTEEPAPGLVRGTIFDGTRAEDLIASPWLWAAPFLVALAAWIYWRTPFGLRLRAFGETPSLRVPGASAWRTRLIGLAAGSLFVVPGAALLLRQGGPSPPVALGLLALACAIAGRWAFAPALLLAAGVALLRTLRPYAGEAGAAAVALETAPFLLALLYLVLFSRRSLRMTATRQSRPDPDTL
jgi:simple sugar transport system permease protein